VSLTAGSRTTGDDVDSATTAHTAAGKSDALFLNGKTSIRRHAPSNGASGWADLPNVNEEWEVDQTAQEGAESGKGAQIIGVDCLSDGLTDPNWPYLAPC
jgi:hypothetical protein